MPGGSNPPSLLAKIIRICWMILGAVIALTIALRLLACIWVPLVLISLAVLAVTAAVWWARQRDRW